MKVLRIPLGFAHDSYREKKGPKEKETKLGDDTVTNVSLTQSGRVCTEVLVPEMSSKISSNYYINHISL